MIRELVEEFIAHRPHKAGETIQFGWFIFTVTNSENPPEIETLDFKQIASFTADFCEVERIHQLQQATLARHNRGEQPCTLRHSALASLSYSPDRKDVFLKRDPPTDPNDSGWYVGVLSETRSMNDASSFARRSLYEFTISDMRMAPYWLLPIGTTVILATGEIS